MPVERYPISRSQFCELVGIDPVRLCDIEYRRETITLCLEPVEMTQTSGTCPPLTTGKKTDGKKIGGRK